MSLGGLVIVLVLLAVVVPVVASIGGPEISRLKYVAVSVSIVVVVVLVLVLLWEWFIRAFVRDWVW